MIISLRDVTVAAVLTLGSIACSAPPSSEELTTLAATTDSHTIAGPYLDQPLPGAEPEIFAAGIVSTGLAERDMAMPPGLDEIYYSTLMGSGQSFSAIVVARRIDDRWTQPEIAPFSGRYRDLEPAISPDGETFMFVSDRPLPGTSYVQDNEDIWSMRRTESGWTAPSPVGPPINTDRAEFFPSLTRDGTLYFTRRGEDRSESIYRARWVDGAYQEPEKLGPEVNGAPTQFNAFIDPDERFLIVCAWGRDDSLGGVDYYVSFRSEEDEWTDAVNLGPTINTATGQEWSPYVSPDGRFFFFMSSRSVFDDDASAVPADLAILRQRHAQPMNGNSDIWWIDAGFLESLRPEAMQ